MKRDTFKYHFKVGNKIVHGGITNNLDRREQEHATHLLESARRAHRRAGDRRPDRGTDPRRRDQVAARR